MHQLPNVSPLSLIPNQGFDDAAAALANPLNGGGRREAPLKRLFEGLGTLHKAKPNGRMVRAIMTDSRRVIPGTLFIARRGLTTDGNHYVEEAISRGAEAIVSEEVPGRAIQLPWLQVTNAQHATAQLAKRFYEAPDASVDVLAVTGTNGKTTVTMLAQAFLRGSGQECGLIGTVRYDVGARSLPAFRTTPEAVDTFSLLDQMRRAGLRYVAMEASSHALAQDRLCGLHVPVAAFLNLTQDHLDYHGDFEHYFLAKARLFDGSLGDPPRIAILPSAGIWSQRLRERLPSSCDILTFGAKGDFRAEAVSLGPNGARFRLHWPCGNARVVSPLLGAFNVDNVLAASALVAAAGFDLTRALPALNEFNGVPGRMERVIAGQPFNVIVDYAHTDDALDNALRMLRSITPGRLLLVFGCGGNRDRAKRPLMMQAAERHADLIWATADNPRREAPATIFTDMRQGCQSPERVTFISDRRRAITLALGEAREGDAVLIAGKGHETFQEYAETVQPFDDRLVARELLRNRHFRTRDD